MTKNAHDAYIARSAEFAQPILEKIRKAFRAASKDIEETMKWSTPHWDYRGILAGISAHKAHVRFGFWRGKDMEDPEGILESMGKSDVALMRFESASDVPSQRVLVRYVKEAMRLNEAAKTAPKKAAPEPRRKPAKELAVPEDLELALAKRASARKTFEGLSPSHRKEYVEWITGAKREATRAKRIATALEYLSEGKPLNWKYMPQWRS